MKLSEKNGRSTIAGEYVLGTLRGPARRRFERELRRDAQLRAEVAFWEEKFSPWLLSAAPPERPPRRVWEAIQAELGSSAMPRQAWWERMTVWRSLALAASALALVLALSNIYLRRPGVPAGQFYAYLQDPGVEPSYFIRLDSQKSVLQVKPLKPPPVSEDQALELWMLPGEGKSPISLGLLPTTGEKGVPLTSDQLRILLSAAGLAVSLEPKGGSPTGLPTGPILYQGSLQAIL
jgi:anti-sigma-K factor RskA